MPSNGCGPVLRVWAARAQQRYEGSNLEFTGTWACRPPAFRVRDYYDKHPEITMGLTGTQHWAQGPALWHQITMNKP